MEGGVSSGGNSCLMGSGFGGDNTNNNSNTSSHGGGGGGGLLCPINMFPTSHHHHNQNPNNALFHLQNNNNNHNNSSPSNFMLQPSVADNPNNNTTFTGCYLMDTNTANNGTVVGNHNNNHGCSSSSSVKAKIISHPHYHRLLAAYVNCQKIGAPPEVVARLEEAYGTVATMGGRNGLSSIGEDPALDQFMEAYCEMLTKYEQELSKPYKEAMLFLSRIECQFKALTIASSDSACGDAMDRNGSSEEEVDVTNNLIDPQAEDQELKGQLLRKYSGYLGSLKQEFMKKRKKGKLPKEARQQLLEWWSRHYKWPYPSETQKLALAESTGLDQKQINNWFINQRKRHWKPSEDMQFVVMDAAHPTHYYMDNVLGNPFPMDISPPLL